MSEVWNAVEFVQRLDLGEYNGRLVEIFGELTQNQLTEVCKILADRMGETNGVEDREILAAVSSLIDRPDE